MATAMSRTIDNSTFANEPFVRRVEKPWGCETIFTPKELPYTGKVLHIDANRRLSLQIHDQKQETLCLVSGSCLLIVAQGNETLVQLQMERGKGYTVVKGQMHRLHALEDSDVFEVSTPDIGTTIRLEDDWQRPDETNELRKDPNTGRTAGLLPEN